MELFGMVWPFWSCCCMLIPKLVQKPGHHYAEELWTRVTSCCHLAWLGTPAAAGELMLSPSQPTATTTSHGLDLVAPAFIHQVDSHHCLDHCCCYFCKTLRLLPCELCVAAYQGELTPCQPTKLFHISCYWTANSCKHTPAISIGKEFLLLTGGTLMPR